jgi:hypothetical protein
LLKDEGHEEEWESGSVSEFGITNQAFVFGLDSTHISLLRFHPRPTQIQLYWRLFQENCDPLIKVLHVPSVDLLIQQATEKLGNISKGLESLMFAIYFSVVVSIPTEECVRVLGSEKAKLIRHFKFSVEQALARAGFLETDEIIVLQAFVIFLTGLRNYCSIRLMWTLTSLAVRLAQNAGIHRDGTHFDLPPFQVEMRRRLWWCICILDSRASEDSGYDAAIQHNGVDTQPPLNVHDSDLSPSITELPKPRSERTAMTFSVIRCEATKIFRRIQYKAPICTEQCARHQTTVTLKEKCEWIKEHQQRLQELFLKQCDSTDPMAWYTAVISRLVLGKMWLVAHHPYLRRRSVDVLPQDIKDRLFSMAISTIEDWVLLNNEPRTSNLRWLCETYIQWYAVTFLLSELCTRTEGEVVDRAWCAVDATFDLAAKIASDTGQTARHDLDGDRNDPFKPLRRLLAKARSARETVLFAKDGGSSLREDMTLVGDVSPETLYPEINNLELPSIAFDNFQFGYQDSSLDISLPQPGVGNISMSPQGHLMLDDPFTFDVNADLSHWTS